MADDGADSEIGADHSEQNFLQVTEKHVAASEICNEALQAVLAALKPGASLLECCRIGDDIVRDRVSKVYTKGVVQKGLAFPCCISVNNVCGHYCPSKGDSAVFNTGDLVKVDLGVHIDGYAGIAAHSTVVPGPEGPAPITGRKADVLMAVHHAVEAALRLIRPGNKNEQVTEVWEKIAKAYDCRALAGVLSHRLSQFVIDGEQCISSRSEFEHKVDRVEFEPLQAWGVDIVMSTGEGKSTVRDDATTVYRRQTDVSYQLKTRAARIALAEINKNFPTFPFSFRDLASSSSSEESPVRLKLGLGECQNHGLIVPYPVLYEANGEFVAQVKFTVLLLPAGTHRTTGIPLDLTNVHSEKKIEDPEVLDILRLPIPSRRRKKRRKRSIKPPSS